MPALGSLSQYDCLKGGSLNVLVARGWLSMAKGRDIGKFTAIPSPAIRTLGAATGLERSQQWENSSHCSANHEPEPATMRGGMAISWTAPDRCSSLTQPTLDCTASTWGDCGSSDSTWADGEGTRPPALDIRYNCWHSGNGCRLPTPKTWCDTATMTEFPAQHGHGPTIERSHPGQGAVENKKNATRCGIVHESTTSISDSFCNPTPYGEQSHIWIKVTGDAPSLLQSASLVLPSGRSQFSNWRPMRRSGDCSKRGGGPKVCATH